MRGTRSQYYSGFDPRSIPGCQLWFDAADPATFSYSSGSSISQWRDKSSNAYSVIQPTGGNQPTLTQGAQNSLPGIQFATNTFLYQIATSMPNFTTGSSTSVLIAARNASVNTSWNNINTLWFTVAGGSASSRYHFSFNQVTTAGTTLYRNGALVGQVTSNPTPPSSNAILGFTTSPTSATIHTNSSTNSYGGATLINATGSTAFIFNDPRNDPAISRDIMIFEMVGYNTQISIEQRQQLEGYLASKWGLRANLPAVHPFRTVPPTLRPLIPTDISGCGLWLDAADSSVVTTSGGNVATMLDKSGNGRTGTETGTVTYVTGAINGLNALSYAAIQNSYIRGSFPNTTTTLSCFMVATLNSNASQNTRVISVGVTSTFDFEQAAYAAAIARTDSLNQLRTFRAGVPSSNVTITYGVPFVANCIYDGSTMSIVANGTRSGTTASTGSFNTTTYQIGAALTQETNTMWSGFVGEVIFYTGGLTDGQRQQVEGYLAWKWGLQASLPATHLYSRVSPSVASFLPTSIPGSILWWDAADPAVFTGGATWIDKSGSNNTGINGTPGTTTMPTQVPWTNGNVAARFVAGSKSSVKSTNTIPNVNVTYFIVSRIQAAPGSRGFIMINNIDGQRQIFINTGFPTTVNAFASSAGGSNVPVISVAQSQGFQYCGTIVSAANGFRAHANGAFVAARNISNSSPSTHYFGSGNGDSDYITMDVGEIVIYDTVLSTDNRQRMEGYLAHKWGLQATLPTSHPYRLIRP